MDNGYGQAIQTPQYEVRQRVSGGGAVIKDLDKRVAVWGARAGFRGTAVKSPASLVNFRRESIRTTVRVAALFLPK